MNIIHIFVFAVLAAIALLLAARQMNPISIAKILKNRIAQSSLPENIQTRK